MCQREVQKWDFKGQGTGWHWKLHNYEQLSDGHLKKYRPGVKLILSTERKEIHIYMTYMKGNIYSNLQ